ncbi:MAG: hypothetical protein ABIF18_04040 [archaeon]
MENLSKNGIPQNYKLENMWNTSQEFDSVGKAKVDSLKEIIIEIENMIEERKSLSRKFIKEGENMKANIHNFLLENAPKGENDSEFTRERAELRKKQIEISELQLNEKIGCWRDMSLLKKELRENTKELNEKESRAEMLGKILKE